MRIVVIVASAIMLLAISLYPEANPDGAAAGAVGPASTGSFDKLEGTASGNYHLSFADYFQEYNGVTTANITWVEDPESSSGCHCRIFYPEGQIDWTFSYADDNCVDSDEGQVEAGVDLFDKNDQMLILWDDPDNDDQYFYSGNGIMSGDAFLNCDGGFTIEIPDFFHVSKPDVINTATPGPFAAAIPASPIPSCEEPFKVARDATRISGSCYASTPHDPLDYTKYEWDFGLKPEPIIFIHGFLGSRMSCSGSELWPNIPPRPNLAEMALAANGTSPAAGACAPTVGDLLDAVPGKNIYGHTEDFLNQLVPPDMIEYFNWDWRKSPQESLAALDNLIGSTRSAHEDAKVVIMSHSYGGLLARLYVDNPSRAENVARVVTIGTPAWGSAKALFPLFAGVETPEFSPLDLLIDNDDLKEFARNLAGAYFLYPSASYGPWLAVGAFPSAPVDRQGLLDYVTVLGGNATLLDQALSSHASTLDPPYIPTPGGPAFEVIVGTGEPTISTVRVLPGGYLQIRYTNGDGTVPGKSAARGVLGSGNPNKSRTYYSCGVGHVDLPGHSQITDAIDDFLEFGEDIEGLENPCSSSGFQFRIFHLPAVPASAGDTEIAAEGTGGALPIEDAVLQGVVDYLDLPNEKFVITGEQFPAVALPAARFLEVTPLSDDDQGQPTLYGPLDGQITIAGGNDGPEILLDGEPAPPAGDVNCDGVVDIADALLLLLHAGGTPGPQPNDCAAIGSGADPFGDIDCDQSVTALDALADMRIVAGVPLTFVAACQ